jgi:SHS2 domain-containing protein
MVQLVNTPTPHPPTLSSIPPSLALSLFLSVHISSCAPLVCWSDYITLQVKILAMDLEKFTITVEGKGEEFTLTKHPQGTEVKAITYSNMQIHKDQPTHDIYVIVDI